MLNYKSKLKPKRGWNDPRLCHSQTFQFIFLSFSIYFLRYFNFFPSFIELNENTKKLNWRSKERDFPLKRKILWVQIEFLSFLSFSLIQINFHAFTLVVFVIMKNWIPRWRKTREEKKSFSFGFGWETE